jgi:ABC-type antimicrobial peptide transport system ATPase subunit
LKNVLPYDYSGDVFSNFTLKDPPKSIPLRYNTITSIDIDHTDKVNKAVNSLVITGILSDYNSITSRMNAPARKQFRDIICSIILDQADYDIAKDFLDSLSIDGKSFIDRLKTKYFKNLQQAIIYYVKGHTIAYVTTKYGIKDSYEITYFAKMIKGKK